MRSAQYASAVPLFLCCIEAHAGVLRPPQHPAPHSRRTLVRSAWQAGALPLLLTPLCTHAHGASPPQHAGCEGAAAATLPPVLDCAGVFRAQPDELSRLDRILRSLEEDTGYKLRVFTTSARARADPQVLSHAKQAWRVRAERGRLEPDAVVVVADLGIPGSLEAGSPYLRYDVGANVRLALPDVFWGRLQREYGKRAFVEARGQVASIVVSCELVLTCLRNEEYCTDVPSAQKSYF
ncbi:hypothetical protein AB1Y20_011379 [Prymnesium parvum]|uniref:Uncharacterized protein n=1 Tax=Prymnesium parvum TaxID=97485 RepID=A0AB34IPD8_PRYPA